MRILYDCHLHSDFSADSETPAEKMVQRAISLQLKGMCFTEHLDPDSPLVGADFTKLDLPAYSAGIQVLREQFRGQISIGFGLEFGLLPHLGPQLQALDDRYPFDYIIASLHFVRGMDPYYPEFFSGRSERDCYEEYFRTELETLRRFPPDSYDALGHMDFIVRYGPNKNRDYSYEAYADSIDPILRYLIENGKCLELNTGGYKNGLHEPNPCAGVFRRYRELGGELVTIGSDAHRPEQIALAFDQAYELLSSLGFQYYTVFEQRKGRQIPL